MVVVVYDPNVKPPISAPSVDRFGRLKSKNLLPSRRPAQNRAGVQPASGEGKTTVNKTRDDDLLEPRRRRRRGARVGVAEAPAATEVEAVAMVEARRAVSVAADALPLPPAELAYAAGNSRLGPSSDGSRLARPC